MKSRVPSEIRIKRLAELREAGLDCQGRAIERPDLGDRAFCNNTASELIRFVELGQDGQPGEEREGRVCGTHHRRLNESDRFRVIVVVKEL
jgi:hypothetical protein